MRKEDDKPRIKYKNIYMENGSGRVKKISELFEKN